VDFVALDAITDGNTATALGPRDACVEVAAGSSFDVDVAVDGVPPVVDVTSDGLGGLQFLLRYGSDHLTAATPDFNFLLASDPDSSLFGPPPTVIDAGLPQIVGLGALDIAGGAGAEQDVSGVGARVGFTAGPGSAGQYAFITLLPSFGVNVTKLITVDNDTFGIGNFPGGANEGEGLNVVVAVSPATCEDAPEPTPEPTPDPTPEPTPETPTETPPAPDPSPQPDPVDSPDPGNTETPDPSPSPSGDDPDGDPDGTPTPTGTASAVRGVSALPAAGGEGGGGGGVALWLAGLAGLLMATGAIVIGLVRSRGRSFQRARSGK
jgi:hypothetical protein